METSGDRLDVADMGEFPVYVRPQELIRKHTLDRNTGYWESQLRDTGQRYQAPAPLPKVDTTPVEAILAQAMRGYWLLVALVLAVLANVAYWVSA
jgi:hypothetical protein